MMKGKALVVCLQFWLIFSLLGGVVFTGGDGGHSNIVSGEESTDSTVIWIHNL